MEWNKRGITKKEHLRLADIQTFLMLYNLANARKHEGGYKTYQELTQALEKEIPTLKHVTVLQQLARVAGAFGGPVTPKDATRWLFGRDGKTGPVVPTPVADELDKWLHTITDVYARAEEGARRVQGQPVTTVIRMGSPQTVGLHLLPYMLSRWQSTFGDHVQLLKVEVADSSGLINRLVAGALDCVLAFGRRGRPNVEQDDPREPALTYVPLGLDVRTVLLAHPNGKVWSRTKQKDYNGDYWTDFKTSNRSPDKRLGYQQLKRSLDLEDIDFKRTRLITVPTWYNTDRLRSVIEKARETGQILQVGTFDEAIAHVRMNQGIAPAPAVFSRRRGVTAFRLQPEEDYIRAVGMYYRKEPPPPPVVRLLIDFLMRYFTVKNGEFVKILHTTGEAPGFDNETYQRLCEDFKREQDKEKWKCLRAQDIFESSRAPRA